MIYKKRRKGYLHVCIPLTEVGIKLHGLDGNIFIYMCMDYVSQMLTLKGPGGGGIHHPSTFRAIILWKFFFFAPRAFMTFFFQVLRNFSRYFRENWAYGSKVTQHYVIECRLKIWKFSGFVYKTSGKWLLVPKLHFEL